MRAIPLADADLKPVRTVPADAPGNLVSAYELGRVVNLEQSRAKFGQRLVNAMVENMIQGDELAYDAWRALMPLKGTGKRMLMDAIEKGIGVVDNPPRELVDLFSAVDTVPGWVDWEQLRRGGIAIWRAGNLVPICLAYSSVGFGFSSYGGTKALNFTRLLIDTDRAGTRMSETLRWFAAVTTPDGMRRFNNGFKYSMRVRTVHCAVRHGVSKSPQWKWNDWGLPITNTDLFFTTSKVFCANLVEALTRLGIRYTAQDKEDIFALWRYIAYVMGVPDELNHVDMQDALIKNDVVLAVERAPDEACRILLHSLIGYTTDATEGYQALPAWLINRLSKNQKLIMSYGLIRYLTNDKFCEDMYVPDSKTKHLVRILARAIAAKESLRAVLPHDDEQTANVMLAQLKKALAVANEAAIASADEVQHALQTKAPDLERQSSAKVE